jgi:hypothetical protein
MPPLATLTPSDMTLIKGFIKILHEAPPPLRFVGIELNSSDAKRTEDNKRNGLE